jgi:hypothetical protein
MSTINNNQFSNPMALTANIISSGEVISTLATVDDHAINCWCDEVQDYEDTTGTILVEPSPSPQSTGLDEKQEKKEEEKEKEKEIEVLGYKGFNREWLKSSDRFGYAKLFFENLQRDSGFNNMQLEMLDRMLHGDSFQVGSYCGSGKTLLVLWGFVACLSNNPKTVMVYSYKSIGQKSDLRNQVISDVTTMSNGLVKSIDVSSIKRCSLSAVSRATQASQATPSMLKTGVDEAILPACRYFCLLPMTCLSSLPTFESTIVKSFSSLMNAKTCLWVMSHQSSMKTSR